jgi:hypothetical protein
VIIEHRQQPVKSGSTSGDKWGDTRFWSSRIAAPALRGGFGGP